MKKITGLLFFILFMAFAGIAVTDARGADKTANADALKGAMKAYIEMKIVDGGGVYKIDGKAVKFDYIHSGIEKRGRYYVSCADFTTGNDRYDVDYYVRDWNGTVSVAKEVLHKKNGKVVDKTLWP